MSHSASEAPRKRRGPVRVRKFEHWHHWPTDSFPAKYSDLRSSRLEYSTNPELEDQSILEWGVNQSYSTKEPRAKVDVVFGRGTDLKWRYDVDDQELGTIANQGIPQNHSSLTSDDSQILFRVFFIGTLDSLRGWLPGNFSIRPTTLSTLRKAGLSNVLLSSIFSRQGFWAKMGNQCYMRQDEKGTLTSFEIIYRYVCGWDTGVGFTHFIRTRHQHTYFCINYPAHARDRLEANLQHNPGLAHRDFFLDALAADQSLREWEFNIGKRREALLRHETHPDTETTDFNTATRQLHGLSKGWHTLQQDCLDLHAQIKFFQDSYQKYMSALQDPKNGWKVDLSSNIGESFEVLRSQCDNYVRWTVVYRDRTNIRINLLFHLANQRDARTSTLIASSTAKVAEQTRRDSASMITIAAVTMLFLPGTFISAILSTTFFDFDRDGLIVSRQWWILPASTIPLMIVVFGVWIGWQYKRFGAMKTKEGQGGVKVE